MIIRGRAYPGKKILPWKNLERVWIIILVCFSRANCIISFFFTVLFSFVVTKFCEGRKNISKAWIRNIESYTQQRAWTWYGFNKPIDNIMWICDISGTSTWPNCDVEAERGCVYRESDLSTSNLIIIPCPWHASIIDMATSLIAIPAIGLVRGRTAMASVTLG